MSRSRTPKRSRRHRAARYVFYSQVSFFGMLAVCIVLIPNAAVHHLGLSYYGTHERTVGPYVGGLFLTGYFMVKAAHALPQATRTLRILTETMFALAVLIVGVSLTPYTVDALFDWVHVGTSAFLFLVELIVAVWLVHGSCRGTLNYLLLAVELFGAFVALFSEVNAIDFMFSGEIVTQLAFGILLIRCVHDLTVAHVDAPGGPSPEAPSHGG